MIVKQHLDVEQLEFLWCQSYIKEIREYFYKVLPLYRVSGEWTLTYTISATEQENKRTRKSVPTMMQKSQILKYVILENSKISSTKKIRRPILVNPPTYYIRFSSDHAQPTYLPKIGRH